MDENCDFLPDDMLQKFADLGTMGLSIPEEYGGSGLGAIEKCIICEEIATSSVSATMSVGLPDFGSRSIIDWGNEAQKQNYLPQLAAGKLKWSLALSEPAGGTDILGAIRTKGVSFWDSLPKSAVGKILKKEVKEFFWKDHERKIS